MDHDTYCIEVCKAKCCRIWDEQEEIGKCPKLGDDCKCSVYDKRFKDDMPKVVIIDTILTSRDWYKQILCGRVKDVLKRGDMPDWIRDQCCYYDESLLNVQRTTE